jgi:hypothetical protein
VRIVHGLFTNQTTARRRPCRMRNHLNNVADDREQVVEISMALLPAAVT